MTNDETKSTNVSGTPRERMRVIVERDTPVLRRSLALKAFDGQCSPRSAIKAKCQECCGYEEVVVRIRECTTHRCPLWAFRPYQPGEIENDLDTSDSSEVSARENEIETQ